MKCFKLNEEQKIKSVFLNFVKMKDVGRLLFPILLTFLSFSIANSQVVVTLGDDIAICQGDDVQLSDLDPFVSGANGDIWWEAGDDNHNSAGFNDTTEYPTAISYTPDANDIAAGYVIIKLKAREFNPNGPVTEASAKVYLRGDVLFACNDKVIVPLNFHCEYQVTPPMVLEGEDSAIPYTLYDVNVVDENGNQVVNELITNQYIGQTLSYTVTHECSWNSCSGLIVVKDNYHPIISCENDTVTCKYETDPEFIGFPIDTSIFDIDTIYKAAGEQFKYIVEGWDACGLVELSYRDDSILFSCSDDTSLQEIIIRAWTAVDESGNTSKCTDSIFVERIPVDSVVLPPSWNMIDTTALQCDGDWLLSALPNGNPSPEYTGEPEIWWCSGIEFNYEDSRFEGCGNTFDVIRKWTIVDWCHAEDIIHYTQIIKVMDTIAPTMVCTDDTIIVGSDPYECNSRKYELAVPQVSDNCSSFSLFVRVFDSVSGVEATVTKENGKYYVQHLPLGKYHAKFSAIDDCDNISECQYEFEVVDDIRPYMICDQHTKVNLGTNGEARLHAEKVDDGSFDNCEIVEMEIRKMTYGCDSVYFEFGEYVDFCCDESGQTLMVAMRATDASGNQNTCMVEVIVEDKLPPQIICPDSITISCDFYFNSEDLSRYFGKVVRNESDREDIVIHDYYNNGVAGRDGLAYDNCDVSVEVDSLFDLNNCNIGTITRTFTATDNGGRTNLCEQVIRIYNTDPFDKGDITWPDNVSEFGCSAIDADTSKTGSPKVNDNGCSMIAMNYEDQLFTVQGDACKKILRTWTIRDWCQSDYIYWTHEQVIMLTDTISPEFTSNCSDREVPVYGECKGLVELSAAATDNCTENEFLLWRWKLDTDGDGIYDDFGQDNHFSRTMDEGEYEIAWIVEDRCGNESICEYKFTVKDRKKPTPLCITDLTTVVMNYGGMVTVDADKFNLSSSDNCTPQEELVYSFSEDTSYTQYNITCDSLIDGVARTFYLKMWVTDNADNQDYCNVLLRVTDNNGVCEDTEGMSVSGKAIKWKDESPVKGINIELTKNNGEYVGNETSKNNGTYKFNNVSSSQGISLEPKDATSSCVEGVSTLDIVTLQKHILGIKTFASPYQYIASDVNRSKSLTAGDILMIRKLILGAISKFPKNDCWAFVDAKQQLTNNNPYNYNSKLVYNNITSSVIDADFKVVKMGDVNGSFNVFGLVSRNENNSVLTLDDINMQEGTEYQIPVYLNTSVNGMQFSIEFNTNDLEFTGYTSQQFELDNSNFGYYSIDRGVVTFSWNSLTETKVDVDSPLFFLNVKAKTNVSVANSVNINSKITKALLVKDGKEIEFNLNYRGDELVEELEVYQNSPNPFNGETTIRFSIPKSDLVTIEIYNLDGKLIYNTSNRFEKGMNTITLSDTEIKSTGVFYYTIKVAESAITKKMIAIK